MNNWDESYDAFQYWYEKGGLEKVKEQMPGIFGKHQQLSHAAGMVESATLYLEVLAKSLLPDHEVTDD